MEASANPSGNQDRVGVGPEGDGGGAAAEGNPSNGTAPPGQGLKHNPGLAVEWSHEEQAILETGLNNCESYRLNNEGELSLPWPPLAMGSGMDFSWEDGRKLCSVVWRNEVLLNKKRRWLMGLSVNSTSDGTQKRSKRPKFLSNVLLPESYLRTDEVSTETMQRNIKKSFGWFGDSEGSHHMVQDYLYLFDMHKLEGYSVNPSHFVKAFSSIINDLNNAALCHIANMVTSNKVSFEKKRPRMKKIIKEYLHKYFANSSSKDRLILLKELSQIFRNPINFRKKELILVTPLSPSLRLSIHKVLERIDEVPFQTLAAMNSKLRCVTVVPQFPPILSTSNRDLLIQTVSKKCEKLLSTIKEGTDLPKPLAKALSVMCLSLKQKTRHTDILASEFFPFPSEVVDIQNDILRALWSLQKVKYDEMKALQPVIDPRGKVPNKTFRQALRKYLMEYLFHCDEIDIPEEVLHALAFINRRSKRQSCTFLKEMREEETEAVLNMSSYLKQVVLNLFPNSRIDKESVSESSESIVADDESENNDFKLQGNDYCSNPDEFKWQQLHGSCSLIEEETSGDSRPSSTSVPVPTEGQNYPPMIGKLTGNIHVSSAIKEPKLEQDADINAQPCSQESVELCSQNNLPSIQDMCDETSLVSYRLIGRMLDKFIQTQARDIDALTRSYLRGGSLPPKDLQGCQASVAASKEDTGCLILLQVVEELLPSFPTSSIKKLKNLMGLP